MNRKFKWLQNGDLIFWFRAPGFINHPVTGEELWFNQLFCSNHRYLHDFERDYAPFDTKWGDGTDVTDDELKL